MYDHLEDHPEVFEAMACFNYDIITVSTNEFAEPILGCNVTSSFFDIFGVRPVLGRVFRKEEGNSGDDSAIIISDSLWRSRFGGQMDIVGRPLQTSEKTFIVVGVMPPSLPISVEGNTLLASVSDDARIRGPRSQLVGDWALAGRTIT